MTLDIFLRIAPSKLWIGLEIDVARRTVIVCPLPGIAIGATLSIEKRKP